MKALFIILGSIALSLGVIGIFVPGLPTTPFLLLTAALYLRGSEKLYNRVISHRVLGKYLHNYQSREGMTVKSKIVSIILMWTMISVSGYFFLTTALSRAILILIGLIGTLVMGFIIKTGNKET